MGPQPERILILMAGGTIDAKTYAVKPKKITPLERSAVPDAVRRLKGGERCDFLEWKLGDSQDFTAADMAKLTEIIRSDPHRLVIITHGTSDMPEHARAVSRRLSVTDKTVVFTGAMVPLSHGEESDGPGNLQYVLEHIDALPAGVHVAMDGQVFSPHGLRKDEARNEFYVEHRGGTPTR